MSLKTYTVNTDGSCDTLVIPSGFTIEVYKYLVDSDNENMKVWFKSVVSFSPIPNNIGDYKEFSISTGELNNTPGINLDAYFLEWLNDPSIYDGNVV